jgi:hypothetical protein
LSKVEPFFILQKIEKTADAHMLKRLHHFYKRDADTYVGAKRKEFEPIVSELIYEVSCFFETLLPPFQRVYTTLK